MCTCCSVVGGGEVVRKGFGGLVCVCVCVKSKV